MDIILKLNVLFCFIQSRLSISTSDASVRDLTPDKKWFILCNESALTSMGTVVGKKNPNSRTSISGHSNNSSNSSQSSPNNTINESHIQNSEYLLTPAYYIDSLLKRESKLEVRSKLVSDLCVRLRTLPIR